MGSRSQRDDRYDEGYYTDHSRRRHRSSPPKNNRARSSVTEDTPQRPKYAKDDSYYNPRDKYYLSGGDELDLGYFARPREDAVQQDDFRTRHRRHSPSPRRYRSPSPDHRRHRRHDDDDYGRGRHTMSPRRYRSPSPDNLRQRYHDNLPNQYHEDDEDRRSRHSKAASVLTASSARRSMTAAPTSAREHRESRRDHDRHYPPNASSARPTAHRKRSSTMPSSTSRRPRSSSSASSSKSPTDWAKDHKDLFIGAARTALQAGAVAAVKLRDDPSSWIGIKGTKVVTTALSAALIDSIH